MKEPKIGTVYAGIKKPVAPKKSKPAPKKKGSK